MARPVNDRFNEDVIAKASAVPRKWRCEDCKRWDTAYWEGDLPTRCKPCAHRHNLNVGAKPGDEPWDLSICAGADTPLEALDRVLHWSPEKRRYLFWDGYRWVWSEQPNAEKIAHRVLDIKVRCEKRTDQQVAAAMQLIADLKRLCEQRAAR